MNQQMKNRFSSSTILGKVKFRALKITAGKADDAYAVPMERKCFIFRQFYQYSVLYRTK